MFTHQSKNKKKVFVGLSGGVDSAVSAALLKHSGYDVTGVFIRIVLPGYPCPASADRQDAMRVAAHLRIPFREIDLSKEYYDKVFSYTLAEFAKGHTPNPDTLCNREIKFGLFFEYAMAQGADKVATGHYAQLQKTARGVEMYTSVDQEKDQSYFLWMIKRQQFQRILFPVGDKNKSTVRKLAAKFSLPNAHRKDSQGLCFLGDISMDDMLMRELHPARGAVIDEQGDIVGDHAGVQLYTLGQRHGFTITGSVQKEKKPQFVVAKDIEKNTITVSYDPFPKHATKTKVHLTDTNGLSPVLSGSYQARYRYRQKLIPATLRCEAEKTVVILHAPCYVPIGQSLVLYTHKVIRGALQCVGGGVVEKTELL